MRRSLKALCADRIAEYIADGIIPRFPEKPRPELSNQIFKYLVHYDNQIWSKSHFRVNEILNVNAFSFDGPYLDHHLCALVYDQNLESLELGNVKSWSIVHWHIDEVDDEYIDDEDEQNDEEEYEQQPIEMEDPEGAEYYGFEVVGDAPLEPGQDLFEESYAAFTRRAFEELPAPNPDKIQDDRLYVVEVESMVDKFLNPESKKMLKHLKIVGDNMIACECWLDVLSTQLPSLVSLNIGWYRLTQNDFNDLCNYFERLTRLDITYAAIHSLKGISKLKNLEYLNISKVEIESKEDIEDLFYLQKLRELVLAVDESKTHSIIEHYLSCNSYLAELRYLDLAFNQVTPKVLARLTHTHDKLETIGVVGTSVETSVHVQGLRRKINVLTLGSVETCLRTLEFYISRNELDTETCFRCCQVLNQTIRRKFDELSHEQFRRCIRVLCSYHPHLARNQHEAILCLAAVLGGSRAIRFSKGDRHHVATYVMDMLPLFTRSYERRKCLADAIVVLCNEMMLQTSLECRHEMVQNAIIYVMNEPVLRCKGTFCGFNIILRSLAHLTLYQVRYFSSFGIVDRIITLFETYNFPALADNYYGCYIDIITKFYDIKGKTIKIYDPNDQVYVERLCILLGRFKNRQELLHRVLIVLSMIMMRSHDHSAIGLFKEHCFIEITSALYSPRIKTREHAAFLLVTIYYHIYPDKEKEMPQRAELIESQRVLLFDLVQALEGFVDTPETGYLDGLEYAMKRVRRWQTEQICIFFFELFMRISGYDHYDSEEEEEEEEEDKENEPELID